jgi:hypothetical protein
MILNTLLDSSGNQQAVLSQAMISGSQRQSRQHLSMLESSGHQQASGT